MLILASASEARQALLQEAGIAFVVRPTRVRELQGRGRTLRETVLENARRKAIAAQGDRVLAADTMLGYAGRIYGKPKDRKVAVDLLSGLAGKTHVIGTGVVLREGARITKRYVESKVTLRALSRAAIERIVSRYDATRFAGGYAIRREDPLVAHVEGSFTNVVGLPMEVVLPLLIEREGGRPGDGGNHSSLAKV